MRNMPAPEGREGRTPVWDEDGPISGWLESVRPGERAGWGQARWQQ